MKRVFAFVGFTFAITLIALNIINFSYSYFVLIAAAALFIVSLLLPSLRQGKVIPVILFSALFASVLFIASYTGTYAPQAQLDGECAEVELQLIDAPRETDSGFSYTARARVIKLDGAPQNIKIKLNTKAKLNIDYYTTFKGNVRFRSLGSSAFKSYGYFGNGIFLSARLVNFGEVLDASKPPGYYFVTARLYLTDILSDYFEGDVLGLAGGLLLGNKDMMSDTLYGNLKLCGISHITAVSGLHITIICLLAYELLKLFGCDKWLRLFVTLAVLFAYAGVAGFSKSVIRAGIMITVLLVSRAFDTKADSLNSLGLATFVICLNPFAVADVSAMLTVSAVLGAVVIAPAINAYVKVNNRFAEIIAESVILSISIMLSTLPVMWLEFGYVSLISIILNVIALPLSQLALIALMLCVLFSGIPFIAFIPQFVARLSLGAIVKLSSLCAERLSFLCRNIDSYLFGIAIAVALVFTAFLLLLFRKIDVRIVLAFTIAVFVTCGALNMLEQRNNAFVLINKNGMVAAFDESSAVVIDMDSKGDYYDLCDAVKSLDAVTLVDCDYTGSDIKQTNTVNKNIYVTGDDDTLILNIYNKCFKISDDYVKIDGRIFYRDLNGRFSAEDNILIMVDKGEHNGNTQ